MKHAVASILLLLAALGLLAQSVAIFISGPAEDSSEASVYRITFIGLWLLFGAAAMIIKNLDLGRSIAFFILFMLLGVIGKVFFDILFVIPATIYLTFWSFQND